MSQGHLNSVVVLILADIGKCKMKIVNNSKDSYFNYLLTQINVLNYDNGKKFTRTDRLDAICELLWNSSYRRINANGLFHLYSKVPLSELPDELIVISSHVDCQRQITKCFSKDYDDDLMQGTFDNSLTNAMTVSLMLEDALAMNVVVAFTGDEEEDSTGAADVAAFFRNLHKKIKVIVLDVTDMGWREGCAFTIENNFWSDTTGKVVSRLSAESGYPWRLVPSDPYEIPAYIPNKYVIGQEAEPDESWEYDEHKVECFSLCIPTKGEMHSDDGVLVRKDSLAPYMKILSLLCSEVQRIT